MAAGNEKSGLTYCVYALERNEKLRHVGEQLKRGKGKMEKIHHKRGNTP